MLPRVSLPLEFDHSIFSGAMNDLIDAAKACPMTHIERQSFMEFVAHERTHGFLFKTRVIEKPPGHGLVITLLPGYIQLHHALRAGAAPAMRVIRDELARRQGQSHT